MNIDKNIVYKKFAKLLVNYCLRLKENEKLLINSTPLAEPLLQAIYAETASMGVITEFNISFNQQEKIFYENANKTSLDAISPFYEKAVNEFDAFLTFKAPYDLKELINVNSDLKVQRAKAMSEIKKVFRERSSQGKLRWCLTLFPTLAGANECGMTLEEYEDFVFDACFLYEDDPSESWREIGRFQQHIVDFLNTKTQISYIAPKTNISFSTKGRTWLNSDGKRNMPSGEVFTSPVEDSVNGEIYFSYPTLYQGKDVSGVTLSVENGYITHWSAEVGEDALNDAFKIPGSRYFGEAAIGTNKRIQRSIKNILFDEKIGGSIHMAVGASYKEAGGKNDSFLHWDMITDMKNGGKIIADNDVIYENGEFLI